MDNPLRAELFAAVCALAACGCATVTQEDPPSNLPPGAGSGGTQSGNAGLGGGSPIPPPSNGGSSGTGGSGNTTPQGGASGSGAQPPVSAGGDGGTGGGVPEPDDGFDAGTVLFEETFEDFQAADWTLTEGGTWAISTDPEADGNVYAQTETSSSSFHLAYAGDVSWRSVIVEANFKIVAFNGSSSSYMAGLCVRVSDTDSFYLVGIRSNDNKLGLRSFDGGGNNVVQSDFEDGTTGVWYNLRVEAIANTITAYLDGELMFTATDTTHANGGIGLCTVRASALFDDVRVTAP